MKKKKNVVFGMCVYDDTDGAIFSIQSILLHHKIENPYRFTVANMNPSSPQGALLKKYCTETELKSLIDYYEPENKGSASSKNFIFSSAPVGSIVICMDCHVMYPCGALQEVIDYLEVQFEPVLVQGPLINRKGEIQATHWEKTWSGGMLGKWAKDEDALKLGQPFDIAAQGMGCFATIREHWLGYNPLFKGFGAEEYYIHEKYRQSGFRAVCLPGFKWWHRFERVKAPYPLDYRDRIHNYVIGFCELGIEKEIPEMVEHFKTIIPINSIREGYVAGRQSMEGLKAKREFASMMMPGVTVTSKCTVNESSH